MLAAECWTKFIVRCVLDYMHRTLIYLFFLIPYFGRVNLEDYNEIGGAGIE